MPGFGIDRRAFLIGGASLLGGCASVPLGWPSKAYHQIEETESALGGRIGVAALDTGNRARISYRGGERFAMCSTFKWILAAAVLSGTERGGLNLARRITYSSAEILGNAPITKAHLAEGAMSIADLCAAAVEVSDNTAANLLLEVVGGPAGFTRYLREIGDSTTRLDRTEPSLNTNLANDQRDTTTPDAMVLTMNKILVLDALAPAARMRLIGWMKNCKTGQDRLRAGLPTDWVEGDKTGTGDNGAANDNAIVWPPGRPPVLIAAYVSSPDAAPDARDAAHAKIARIIAEAFA